MLMFQVYSGAFEYSWKCYEIQSLVCVQAKLFLNSFLVAKIDLETKI